MKTAFEFEKQLAAALDCEWAKVLSEAEDGEFPVCEAADGETMDEDAAGDDDAINVDSSDRSRLAGAITTTPPAANPSPSYPLG